MYNLKSCFLFNNFTEANLFVSPATMTKIIKEMLPPDVRVARDAQDLLIECCVGECIMLKLWDFI